MIKLQHITALARERLSHFVVISSNNGLASQFLYAGRGHLTRRLLKKRASCGRMEQRH